MKSSNTWHVAGFKKMLEVIRPCKDLTRGVKEIISFVLCDGHHERGRGKLYEVESACRFLGDIGPKVAAFVYEVGKSRVQSQYGT